MKEALGHGLALHQPHGARIAVRQYLLGILRGNLRKARGDDGDRLIPTHALEAPLALLADAAHGVQQPIGVVGPLRIARNLGAKHAGGGRMRR